MSVKTAIETFIIAAAVGVANLLVAVFALFNIVRVINIVRW